MSLLLHRHRDKSKSYLSDYNNPNKENTAQKQVVKNMTTSTVLTPSAPRKKAVEPSSKE